MHRTQNGFRRMPALFLALAAALLLLPALAMAAGDEWIGVHSAPLLKDNESLNPFTVTFVADRGAGDETLVSRVVENTDPPSAVSVLPEAPFWAGHAFLAWADENGERITANTPVTRNMTVRAQYREINIYKVEIDYVYYTDRGSTGQRVRFDKNIVYVDGSIISGSPVTIASPAQTEVDEETRNNYGISSATFYPRQPDVEINSRLLQNADEHKNVTVDVEYIPYTASYDLVYLLEGLNGGAETEIERQKAYGVLHSNVSPAIKEYSYASFLRAENTYIEQAENQEVRIVYSRKTFTLSYNTRGGSGVASQPAKYGASVPLASGSSVPIRTGYTFDGWYLDEACTQAAGSAVTLEKDTTVYASWKGNQVNYTIVYYVEKYDNATHSTSYVYDNAERGAAQAGSTVYASSAPRKPKNGYVYDENKNAASSVTVRADGSSVLKVYYSLIRYTLVFSASGYLDDGYYYYAGYTPNGTIQMGGRTYQNSDYRIEHVVLGQDVSSQWPAYSTEVYYPDHAYYFTGWYGADEGNYVSKQYELTYNNVSNANDQHVMTFHAIWSSDSDSRNAEYYLQQPDGTYKIEDSYTQIGLNTDHLGAKDIDGYTRHNGDGSAPAGEQESGDTITAVQEDSNGSYVRDDDRTGGSGRTYYAFDGHLYRSRRKSGDENLARYDVTFTYTYRFYYDRLKYTIQYKDGPSILKTTDPIYFEEDISASAYQYIPDKPSGKADYTWGGWYADAELQTPYPFTTMPGHPVIVYAKWIAPTFSITFHHHYPGANPEVFCTQEIEKNQYAHDPGVPQRLHYSFDGWFATADGDARFNFAAPVTGNAQVYARWKRDPLKYTVHYYLEGTAESLVGDKVVESQVLQQGQTITERAVAVPGFLPDESERTITLDDENNVITFFYSRKQAENRYTVRYLAKDENGSATNQEVHAPRTVTVDGATSSVTEMAAAPEGAYASYLPEHETLTLTLSRNADNNVITFYYTSYKALNIKVQYVDMDGVAIEGAQPVEETLKVGAAYPVSPAVSGWTLDHTAEIDSSLVEKAGTEYTAKDRGEVTISVYMRKNLTITANHKEKAYDGTALFSRGPEDAACDGLKAGDWLENIGYNGSQTEPGSSATQPHGAVIRRGNAQGTGNEGVNDYYAITYVNGTLTIVPRDIVVTITGRSADMTYDGHAHEVTGYDVKISNPLYTEADFRFNGAASVSGTDAGSYSMKLSADDFVNLNDSFPNVKFVVENGRLTIHPAEIQIAVTGRIATEVYDGTEKAVTKYKAVSDSPMYSADKLAFTGNARASGTNVGVYGMGLRPAQFSYKDDNIKAAISVKDGRLEITPAAIAITITGKQAAFPYDGAQHQVTGFAAASESPLFRADRIRFTGDDTARGTRAGTYRMGLTANQFAYEDPNINAAFEVTDGQLVITAAPAPTAPPVTTYRLTIRYWLGDTRENRACPDFAAAYAAGSAYSVLSPSLPGYTVSMERVTGVLTEDTEVDVYYTVNRYTLQVYFRYEDGRAAAPSYTGEYDYGAVYWVISPEIAGYTASIRQCRDTMPARNLIITVIYTGGFKEKPSNTEIIDDYNTPLGLGGLGISIGETCE